MKPTYKDIAIIFRLVGLPLLLMVTIAILIHELGHVIIQLFLGLPVCFPVFVPSYGITFSGCFDVSALETGKRVLLYSSGLVASLLATPIIIKTMPSRKQYILPKSEKIIFYMLLIFYFIICFAISSWDFSNIAKLAM